MYKKVNVVMLPTNEKSKLLLSFKEKSFNQLIEPKLILIEEANYQLSNIQSQHLYILSDEEIRKGDWYLSDKNEIKQADTISHKSCKCKKIIATTDNSLTINSIYGINSFDVGMFGGKSEKVKLPSLFNLFQIPQSFIEYFVSEYNKGNIITEVMVEYEPANIGQEIIQIGAGDEFVTSWKIKINSNNTINIKPIKDSWNRDEVIKILHACHSSIYQNNSQENVPEEFTKDIDKWIEENI